MSLRSHTGLRRVNADERSIEDRKRSNHIGLAPIDSVRNLREILPVTPQEFGALADGNADDFAAINLAKAAAVSQGRGLHFPDGVYAHSGTLDFTHYNLKITFGTFATLFHTGVGKAVQVDSGLYVAENPSATYGVEFGWGCPPTLQGNADTTILFYVRASHHMKVDVRLRDCETGCRIDFSVMSYFRIRMTANEGGWQIKNPTNGLIVDKRGTPEATTDCQFDLIIEGMVGLGLDLVLSQHCDYRGTSEGNGILGGPGGGVRIQANSDNNNFSNFFCEQNGAGPHWDIRSSGNIFLNCSGGGASNAGENTNLVPGIRNKFLRGEFHNVTENGFYNEWDQCQLTGVRNMNTNRIQTLCYDEVTAELPDNYPGNQPTSFVPKGAWVGQTDNEEAPHGYYKDRSGTVHFVGSVKNGAGSIFDVPVGFRPAGTFRRPYYNPVSGTSGIIAITADGDLQHISGLVSAVDLSQMSYKAAAS